MGEGEKRVGLHTSIPPNERHQCHPGNDSRNTDHKSGKRRAATKVLDIFAARRHDDEGCRLWWIKSLVSDGDNVPSQAMCTHL